MGYLPLDLQMKLKLHFIKINKQFKDVKVGEA